MSLTDQVVVDVMADMPLHPRSGDLISAIARAERAGHSHAQNEIDIMRAALIEAAVQLESAAKHITEMGMPLSGGAYRATATCIRNIIGLPRL